MSYPLTLAGGSGTNTIVYTTDGINWQPSQSTDLLKSANAIFAGANCTYIGTNGSMWVASGWGGNTSLGTDFTVAAYSQNGLDWVKSPSKMVGVWGGDKWIAGASPGSLTGSSYSSDGISWTVNPNAANLAIISPTWGNGIWVAGGFGNRGDGSIVTYGGLKYSTDGINWKLSPTLSSKQYSPGIYVPYNASTFCWNGTIWLAGATDPGYSALIMASFDGINWTSINPEDTGPRSVSADIEGQLSVLRKSNFDTLVRTKPRPSVKSIKWNGNMWLVLVGYDSSVGKLLYSYDTLTWTEGDISNILATLPGVLSITFTNAVWDNTKWTAVGYYYIFTPGQPGILKSISITSNNGITWTILPAIQNLVTSILYTIENNNKPPTNSVTGDKLKALASAASVEYVQKAAAAQELALQASAANQQAKLQASAANAATLLANQQASAAHSAKQASAAVVAQQEAATQASAAQVALQQASAAQAGIQASAAQEALQASSANELAGLHASAAVLEASAAQASPQASAANELFGLQASAQVSPQASSPHFTVADQKATTKLLADTTMILADKLAIAEKTIKDTKKTKKSGYGQGYGKGYGQGYGKGYSQAGGARSNRSRKNKRRATKKARR